MAYKVGDKFIIEIEEVYAHKVDNGAPLNTPNNLYRMKGFNSLVFDENGLNKLENYNEKCDGIQRMNDAEREYHYQKGLNDAWEAARKFSVHPSMGGLDKEAYKEMFGDKFTMADQVLNNLTAAEAISKIKAYEEQKRVEEEIKANDEIYSEMTNIKVVVVSVDS